VIGPEEKIFTWEKQDALIELTIEAGL